MTTSNYTQFSQPQVMFYNLNEMASQTTTFRLQFNLGQQLDSITPQVALMIAHEVQAQARKNMHPVRVNMHEYISENSYANDQFRNLVFVVMSRIGHGMENREWPNLNAAAQQTVSMLCKAYAGGLAVSDPQFLAGLAHTDPDAAAEVQNQSNDWAYFQALANGAEAYAPFNRGQQFSAVTRSAMQASTASNISKASGVFTDQPVYRPNSNGPQPTADAAPTRYERMLQNARAAAGEAEQQKKQSFGTATSFTSNNAGFGTRSALAAMAAKTQPVTDVEVIEARGKEATGEFDSGLEAQAADKPLAKVRINGEDVSLMRMVGYTEGLKNWKPIDIQPYLPVYCKRTHRLLFFITSTNKVIGVIQPLQDKEKAITMNYEAHRIIPGIGAPDPEAPTVPVREEAKVLYSNTDRVEIRVVTGNVTMTESLENAVKVAQNVGRRADDGKADKREVSLTGAILNTVFTFADKMACEDTVSIVMAAGRSKSLVEAGNIITRIDDAHLRRTIENAIASDINSVLAVELGLSGLVVSGAINTYAKDLDDALARRGDLVVEKYEGRIPSVLQANLKVMPATEASEYSEYFMSVDGEDLAPQEVIERSAILQRNVNIGRVSFSEDELALEIPANSAAVIEKQAVPALYAMTKALQGDQAAVLQASQPDNYLLTNDGYLFKIHRGLLGGASLISKAGEY